LSWSMPLRRCARFQTAPRASASVAAR
jgi:hypothetical protein